MYIHKHIYTLYIYIYLYIDMTSPAFFVKATHNHIYVYLCICKYLYEHRGSYFRVEIKELRKSVTCCAYNLACLTSYDNMHYF